MLGFFIGHSYPALLFSLRVWSFSTPPQISYVGGTARCVWYRTAEAACPSSASDVALTVLMGFLMKNANRVSNGYTVDPAHIVYLPMMKSGSIVRLYF